MRDRPRPPAAGAFPAPRAPGYRVFWRAGAARCFRDLQPGDHLVAGSHARCDIRLRDETDVASRHVLITLVELADGPALRGLDLHTGLPFTCGDGVPRTSVLVDGALAMLVGSQVVEAAPIVQNDAGFTLDESPALPPRAVVSRRTDAIPSRAAPGSRHLRETVLVDLPPPSSVVQLTSHPKEGEVKAWLSVSKGGRGVTVPLDATDLGLGVIVGRSTGACPHAEVRALLGGTISRSHVLILGVCGGVKVFDLCSMNGTHDGREVITSVLVPGHRELRLGPPGEVVLGIGVGD